MGDKIDSYYIGTDLKFLIDAECDGYSMDDGFSIELWCSGKKYECKDDDVKKEGDNWYLTVDTTMFRPGTLQMVFKAEVPDDIFTDGIRTEVTLVNLCKLNSIPAPKNWSL